MTTRQPRGWPLPAALVALVVHIVGAAVFAHRRAGQPGTGDLLLTLRMVVAPAMAACLVLGLDVGSRRTARAGAPT
jgi:hypothetical protein